MARLTRSEMWAAGPFKPSTTEVHDGHGCSTSGNRAKLTRSHRVGQGFDSASHTPRTRRSGQIVEIGLDLGHWRGAPFNEPPERQEVHSRRGARELSSSPTRLCPTGTSPTERIDVMHA